MLLRLFLRTAVLSASEEFQNPTAGPGANRDPAWESHRDCRPSRHAFTPHLKDVSRAKEDETMVDRPVSAVPSVRTEQMSEQEFASRLLKVIEVSRVLCQVRDS
jgi:hypothetical protein